MIRWIGDSISCYSFLEHERAQHSLIILLCGKGALPKMFLCRMLSLGGFILRCTDYLCIPQGLLIRHIYCMMVALDMLKSPIRYANVMVTSDMSKTDNSIEYFSLVMRSISSSSMFPFWQERPRASSVSLVSLPFRAETAWVDPLVMIWAPSHHTHCFAPALLLPLSWTW